MSSAMPDADALCALDRELRNERDDNSHERAKHERTLALLPRARYASALEVGASTGAVGRLLAARCDRYLGIDASHRAIDIARRDVLPRMAFRFCVVPERFPDGPFDLILLSEVLHFLDRADIEALARHVSGASPFGDVVCVSYLGPTGRALDGAQAVRIFSAALGARPQRVFTISDYRIDVFPAQLPCLAYARPDADGLHAGAR